MSEENHGIDRSRCRPGLAFNKAARVVPPSPEEIKKATEEWEKERDEHNRILALRPFSFDPIPCLPVDEEELQSEADDLLDEQLKLIEAFQSRTPEEEEERR
jgi:hypothetical protein